MVPVSQFSLPLLANIESPEAVKDEWETFALSEFQRLMMHTHFARGFFDALRFANKPDGLRGEKAMRDLLRLEYADMFQRELVSPTDLAPALR